MMVRFVMRLNTKGARRVSSRADKTLEKELFDLSFREANLWRLIMRQMHFKLNFKAEF